MVEQEWRSIVEAAVVECGSLYCLVSCGVAHDSATCFATIERQTSGRRLRNISLSRDEFPSAEGAQWEAVRQLRAFTVSFVARCPNEHRAHQVFDVLDLCDDLAAAKLKCHCGECDESWDPTPEERRQAMRLMTAT